MAIRFRKTKKIAPGVRLNIGKRGIGATLGARGASVSAGKGGLHANLGAPGTGLSTRHRLDGGSAPDDDLPEGGVGAPGGPVARALQATGEFLLGLGFIAGLVWLVSLLF